jgi:hypothetical protein
MKAESFTTEWLTSFKPARRTEIADRGEGSRRLGDRSGLVVRIGPGGASKVFFRWEDARDPTTGKVRRRRVGSAHGRRSPSPMHARQCSKPARSIVQ